MEAFSVIKSHIIRNKMAYVIVSVAYLLTLGILLILWKIEIAEGMECGIASQELNALIINGSEAPLGFVPWYVALKLKDWRNPYCGASIISRDWIITAHHCVSGKYGNKRRIDSIVAIAGSQYSLDNTPGTVHRIIDVKVKEDLMENYKIHDIALLRVSPRFKYRKHGTEGKRGIGPVCLPTSKEQITEKEAIAAGFGWNNIFHPSATEKLTVAKFKFLDWDYCNYIVYKNDKVEKKNDRKLICAFSPKDGKSLCSGDSGGPLTTLRRGVHTLVGLASGSFIGGCNYPSYCTNIAEYRDWIKSSTQV